MTRELSARPVCGRCKRPVQSFSEEEVHGRLRLRARCHGESEYVDLEPDEAKSLAFGMAFTQRPRLGA